MKLLILGGGQLARMLALDAAPLGIECQVVDTHAESCAAQVAPFSCRDWSVPGALDDLLAWADAVGVQHIVTVLQHLALGYGEDRYRVSPLIQQSVFAGKGIHVH